jgi:hypothetical protein
VTPLAAEQLEDQVDDGPEPEPAPEPVDPDPAPADQLEDEVEPDPDPPADEPAVTEADPDPDPPAADPVEADPVEGCDATAGLIEVDEGCAVLVTYGTDWTLVGVFFAVLVLVCLGALVVGQLRRS